MTEQTRYVIMLLTKKKYKKILQEVKYLRSELDYQEAVLSEAHLEFEFYYREWCANNDFDLVQLNQDNAKQVEQVFKTREEKLVPLEAPVVKRDEKKISKLYKKLARELHPDKETGDVKKFKKVAEAYKNGDWSLLLEEAVELEIEPENLAELIPLLKEEAKTLKGKIKHNEEMYSWKYHLCDEDDECKQKLVKCFLKQLFNLEL